MLTKMEGASPSTANGGISKFPAFAPDALSHTQYDDGAHRRSSDTTNRDPLRKSLDNDRFPSAWQARRSSRAQSRDFSYQRARGHGGGRQRSLSEAIRVIRQRNGSMSQNAHEIAEALKAPVSPRLVVSIFNLILAALAELTVHDRHFARHGTQYLCSPTPPPARSSKPSRNPSP